MTNSQVPGPLVGLLAQAWQDGTPLDTPAEDLIPADAEAAFAVQHALLDRLGATIGGWKVGAKSVEPDAPIQGSPLPAAGIHASGARIRRPVSSPLILELEIGFRFARTFEPRETPYTETEILAAIGTMEATVELVSTRYREWPNVDKRLQLADLQCHRALVTGTAMPYNRSFPFEHPALQFQIGSTHIAGRTQASNPAGDPRRLLAWLVNHSTARGLAVTPKMIVTTGTYTGMFIVEGPGEVRGTIDGLPPISFELHD